MKAHQKILTIFILLFLLFFAGMVFYSRVQDKNLQKILSIRVQERKNSFNNILTLQRQAIFVLAKDYSYWDELVNAINNEDIQWAKVNIDSGIKTYQADAAWVYNLDFKKVYSVNRYADAGISDLPLTLDEVKQIFNGKSLAHFYIATPSAYLEIEGATVHPSDDSDRMTPSRGYFFVGKVWNKEYLSVLSQLTGNTVTVTPFADAPLRESRDAVFTMVAKDWQQKPLFLITAEVQSVFLDYIYQLAQIIYKLFLVYTVLQMLILLYFLRRFFRRSA